MKFDNELIAAKLRYWDKYLTNYQVPAWDDIPNMGLYMEQVLTLLEEYLGFMPPELQDGELITAATINNYVRKGIMPKPERKRYYRIHLAYLIIICSLKQTLTISAIQEMLPSSGTEAEVRAFYDAFRNRQTKAARYFTEQAGLMAAGILRHGSDAEDPDNAISTDSTAEMVIFCSLVGGYSALLAQKLLKLEGKTMASDTTTHKLSAEEYEEAFGVRSPIDTQAEPEEDYEA